MRRFVHDLCADFFYLKLQSYMSVNFILVSVYKANDGAVIQTRVNQMP